MLSGVKNAGAPGKSTRIGITPATALKSNKLFQKAGNMDELDELLSWEIMLAGLSDRADEAMHEDGLKESYGRA